MRTPKLIARRCFARVDERRHDAAPADSHAQREGLPVLPLSTVLRHFPSAAHGHRRRCRAVNGFKSAS